MKKKFLSIVMVVLLVAVTLIGITACTKEEDKLVGTWFGQEQVEEGHLGRVYYTVITQNKENKNSLVYKQYIIFPSRVVQNAPNQTERESGEFCILPEKNLSKTSGLLNCTFNRNHASDFYKIVRESDDNFKVVRWNGKEEGTEYNGYDYGVYSFERTSMTLDEFKEQYGQYTIEYKIK